MSSDSHDSLLEEEQQQEAVHDPISPPSSPPSPSSPDLQNFEFLQLKPNPPLNSVLGDDSDLEPVTPHSPGSPDPALSGTKLTDLPDALLGYIFSMLEYKRGYRGYNENRKSKARFLHTCKAVRYSDACLQQLTSMRVFLDERKHGSLPYQVSTAPNGLAAVRHLRISPMDFRHLGTFSMCEIGVSISARIPQLEQAFPGPLEQVTELEFTEGCYVNDEDKLLNFIATKFPNLHYLHVNCEVCEGSSFFAKLPQLRLKGLEWNYYYPGICYRSDGSDIAQCQTLDTLRVQDGHFRWDLSRLAALANLRSLTVLRDYHHDDFEFTSGLDLVLRDCTLLEELCIIHTDYGKWADWARLQVSLPTPSLRKLYIDRVEIVVGSDKSNVQALEAIRRSPLTCDQLLLSTSSEATVEAWSCSFPQLLFACIPKTKHILVHAPSEAAREQVFQLAVGRVSGVRELGRIRKGGWNHTRDTTEVLVIEVA